MEAMKSQVERLVKLETEMAHLTALLREHIEETKASHVSANRDRAKLQEDVQTMKDMLNQVKGGKAMLFGLLALAGSIGSFITWLVKSGLPIFPR